jgi:hypothetical protein
MQLGAVPVRWLVAAKRLAIGTDPQACGLEQPRRSPERPGGPACPRQAARSRQKTVVAKRGRDHCGPLATFKGPRALAPGRYKR